MYKNQITKLWTDEYKSKNDESDSQINIQQSDLAAHMYRKRKTFYVDELEVYLNEPPINFDMDILEYWKVIYKRIVIIMNLYLNI
jgi:hypothetical protein